MAITIVGGAKADPGKFSPSCNVRGKINARGKY